MSILWTKEGDDRELELNTLHDALVPEKLDVYLVSFRPNLHWAVAWKALARDPDGQLVDAGWKLLEVRQQVSGSDDLILRFHRKPSNSQTPARWKKKLLAQLDGEERVAIIGWATARAEAKGMRGNCITCVCDVIQDMALNEGLLPATAVDALNEQKAEDIEESTIYSGIHNAGSTGRLWSLSSPSA